MIIKPRETNVGNYRFNPAKGFRRQGKPYGEMENAEYDSEKYDSIDDWLDHIIHDFIVVKESDDEQEIEREGDDDES